LRTIVARTADGERGVRLFRVSCPATPDHVPSIRSIENADLVTEAAAALEFTPRRSREK
jgi:hypothetical protein